MPARMQRARERAGVNVNSSSLAPSPDGVIVVSILANARRGEDGGARMGSLALGHLPIRGEAFLSALVVDPEAMVAKLCAYSLENLRAHVTELASAPTDAERKAQKERLPAWVPAEFSGETRNKAECIGRQVIGHDFDRLVAPTFEDACAGIVAALPNRFLAIHTTASERKPDGAWCLRVYELLDRAATPDEWESRVKPHMRTQGEHDPKALDVARFFFLPIKTAGYRFHVVQGPRTRLDELPIETQPLARVSTATSTPAAPSSSAQSRRDMAANMLGTAWPATGRHNAQLALAGALCRDGWREDAALEFLCAVCRTMGDEDRSKRTNTIRDAYARTSKDGNVFGWTELSRHVDPAIVTAARDLLRGDASDIAAFMLELDSTAGGPTQTPTDAPIAFDESGDLPTFPIQALPPTLRDFVLAEAEATQTPTDMAAMLVLGACSAAIAGKVDLEVETGYREPLNLFVCVALPPAERKSSVFADVFRPLQQAERMKADAAAPLIAMREADRELAEKALKKKKAEYATLTGDQLHKSVDGSRGVNLAHQIQQDAAKLQKMEIPAEPRLLADDVTMERLAGLMAEQGGRLCVASPEGTLFGIIAGRYRNGQASFEVLLKGHAGDALRVDRQSKDRPAVHLERPCLTLALTVQPSIVQALSVDAAMRGQGLLARFLYVLPKSKVGTRRIDAAPVPDLVRLTYHSVVQALANVPTIQERTATADVGQSLTAAAGELPRLCLSDDARTLHRAFRLEAEPRLAGDLADISDWAGKWAGAVARIAGVLHCVEYGPSREVSAETMRAAIEIGRYLLPHAARAFGLMLTPGEETDALAVLTWLRRARLAHVTMREVGRLMSPRAVARSAKRREAAIRELFDRGFLKSDGKSGWYVVSAAT